MGKSTRGSGPVYMVVEKRTCPSTFTLLFHSFLRDKDEKEGWMDGLMSLGKRGEVEKRRK
jgi:hypothetical protein